MVEHISMTKTTRKLHCSSKWNFVLTQTLLEMSMFMKVVMLLKSMVTMLIEGHHVEVGVGVLPSREGRRCYSGL